MKTKNINIRIREEEYEDIKNHSLFFGSTISEFVLEALRERLEYLEDVEDLKYRDKSEPRASWEEVQKKAGLLP